MSVCSVQSILSECKMDWMQVSHTLSICPSPSYALLVSSCLGRPSHQSFPSKVAGLNTRCCNSSTKNKTSSSLLGDFRSCLWQTERHPSSHSRYIREGGALQRQKFSGWFLWTKWQQAKCKAKWQLWQTAPVDSFLTSYVKLGESFSQFPQKTSLPEVEF